MANLTPNTKEEQDSAYSPEEIDKREGAHDDIPGYNRKSDGLDDHPISAGSAMGLGSKEENPSATWKTGFNLVKDAAKSKSLGPVSSKKPLVFILALITGGGLSIGGIFGSLGLLPIHIVEQFIGEYDSQNTSLTIRTDKIIAAKISREITSGSCNVIEIRCRYTRPSNKLITNLARNGIQARAADGSPTKVTTGPFPNERPDHYTYTDRKTGDVVTVRPNEFSNTMRDNASFRAAFRAAYNPRYVAYADRIFNVIKERFTFRARDGLADSKSKDEARTRLGDISKGLDIGVRNLAGLAAGSLTAKAEELAAEKAEELITKEAEDSAKKVAKSGRGNLVGLVAGVACLASDVPGITIKIVRAYQLAQLIKYAAAVLTVVGAIKAGDATPEETSAIGDLFTEIVDGKSALDSFGIKYTLFGDTKTSDTTYRKFSPGSGAVSIFGGVSSVTDSVAVNEACKFAANPITGASLNLALAGSIAGLPAAAANIVVGAAASQVLQFFLPGIIENAVGFLRTTGVLGAVMSQLLGDLTQNLLPIEAGNAFTSGASSLMGQTANAGGNMPLTVEDALAYEGMTDQVNLAYAEEQRATLSPLDASSPYTMLGSMVSQLLPYYSRLGSIGGVMSTVGSMVTGSLGKLSTAYAAADINPSKYQLCDDPAIIDKKVAAGPFCNIQYGIPPKYLDRDPLAVLNELIASGDVDPNTGEPIDKSSLLDEFNYTYKLEGSLKGWIDLCTDGTTKYVEECKITDDTAKYALYTIDRRIQTTMDGEDEVLERTAARGGGTGIKNTSDPRITTVINKKNPMSPLDYAPSDLVGLGDRSGGLRAEAAAAFTSMQAGAAASGVSIWSISSYRSYARQVEAYGGYVARDGQAEADTFSARPGYSEHQSGLAVDINVGEKDKAEEFAASAPGQWLAANAWQYGFVLRYPRGQTAITGYIFEPWHYRYIGIEPAKDMYEKGILTLEDYYGVPGGQVYAYNLVMDIASQVGSSNRSQTARKDIVFAVGGVV